jgi:hypothetical protein
MNFPYYIVSPLDITLWSLASVHSKFSSFVHLKHFSLLWRFCIIIIFYMCICLSCYLTYNSIKFLCDHSQFFVAFPLSLSKTIQISSLSNYCSICAAKIYWM